MNAAVIVAYLMLSSGLIGYVIYDCRKRSRRSLILRLVTALSILSCGFACHLLYDMDPIKVLLGTISVLFLILSVINKIRSKRRR